MYNTIKETKSIHISLFCTIDAFHKQLDNTLNSAARLFAKEYIVSTPDSYQDLLTGNTPLPLKARMLSYKLHSYNAQIYDNKYSYLYHIEYAAAQLKELMKHIGGEEDSQVYINSLCAIYLHDSVEDAGITYNDIRNMFNIDIAEAVFGVTNNRGRTRKERSGGDFYDVLTSNKVSVYCKIADRCANYKYGAEVDSSMSRKYKKENPDFVAGLKGIIEKDATFNVRAFDYLEEVMA